MNVRQRFPVELKLRMSSRMGRGLNKIEGDLKASIFTCRPAYDCCARAAALKQNTELLSLHLDIGLIMSDESGIALAAALKQNTMLRSLVLDPASGMGVEAVVALAAALKENTVLQSFKVINEGVNDNMGDDAGLALTTAHIASSSGI